MKQISQSTAEKLAFADARRLKEEIRYCQADWIRENAHLIADIESKRASKDLYGEWPKGWKAEMKRQAVAMAKKSILDRFLRDECKQLDGAIWLGNFQMIHAIERGA
jgi:hypothetical protein